MRVARVANVAAVLMAVLSANARGQEGPAAIERVELGANREFRVNGQPFFPLMAWLQDADNFPDVRACGMNTVAGYWPGSSGTQNVAQYLELAKQAGLYGVMPYAAELKGRPNLLAYIQGDEPDLPRQVSDAEIVPAEGLRLNASTPLWKILDGVTHSWSVLDPLAGAAITIRLEKPVTVDSLAVWLTISNGLSVAKDVVFQGDGRVILEAQLEQKKGQQRFALAAPATFRELKLTVRTTYAGQQVWGSISEIEGFRAAGDNLLAAPPRYEPRKPYAETLAEYGRLKTADPARPVFMTLTGNFHPHFDKWNDSQRSALYPQYIRSADVVGYDIYPIYGWNKPEWINLVYDATRLLVDQAGGRAVYAWIETSKGGQYTGPLERQKEVAPEHIRAEVWMAICGGATGIGYFTHVWKPSYRQFGPPEENRQAIRAINEQISRLAPALLADASREPVSLATGDGVRVALLAKRHQQQLYLFAVNYDSRLMATDATFSLGGLKEGAEITVIDENRSIRASAGSFTDSFSSLAVHLYQIDRVE